MCSNSQLITIIKKIDIICCSISASPLLVPATNFSLTQYHKFHWKLLHLGKAQILITYDWAEAVCVRHDMGRWGLWSNTEYLVPSQPQKIYITLPQQQPPAPATTPCIQTPPSGHWLCSRWRNKRQNELTIESIDMLKTIILTWSVSQKELIGS